MAQIEHKKNTARYLAIPMVDSTTPANFKTGLSPTDTAYYKDGAGAWTSLAITDTFAEIGSTGVYEIDLTAAECNHDQVIIKVTGSGAADTMVMFDMRAQIEPTVVATYSIDVTIEDSVTSNPLSGARVSLVGLNQSTTTGVAGTVSHAVEAGSYTVRVLPPGGYDTPSDTPITVTASDEASTIQLTPQSLTPSGNPTVCVVAVDVIDQYGAACEGATVSARKAGSPPFASDAMVKYVATTATTDAGGRASMNLIRGGQYNTGTDAVYTIQVTSTTGSVEFSYTVPDAATDVATAVV